MPVTRVVNNNQIAHRKQQLLIGVSVVCAVLFVIVLWLTVDIRRNAKNPAFTADSVRSAIQSSPSQKEESKSEAEKIVQAVGKHIYFPQGEIMVATITDIDLLRQRNPIFFQFAKLGDKILLYPNGIILYEVNEDKIIDIWRILPNPPTP